MTESRLCEDLNMEKINIYLTLVERITMCLETITKSYKSHVSGLEGVFKTIIKSEMIAPFYEAKIDYSAAPDEATTSISMSKNNTFMFQD